MARVKFNVNSEYAYLQNFKILQSRSSFLLLIAFQPRFSRPADHTYLSDAFTRHSIERLVPVEQLIKCRMQDNLEFLQWTKRYWDQYFPGHDYDAIGRRKGSGAPPPAAATPRTSTGASARRPQAAPAPRATPRAAGAAAVGGMGATGGLRAENDTLKEAIAGLEKERDFYFSKLRDIELLLQTAVDADAELEKDENGLVKNIQAILYSTEEGFEIPAEAEGAEGLSEKGDEQETF